MRGLDEVLVRQCMSKGTAEVGQGDRVRAAGQKKGKAGNIAKSGKNLRYEDLRSQFGVGLKEAASRLGICPTTLKVGPPSGAFLFCVLCMQGRQRLV